MTSSPSLTTCPAVIYREILKYIAPCVIVKCDLEFYLTLQRCCTNQTLANEVRSIMKEKLQYVQAHAALTDCPSEVVTLEPSIASDPFYVNALEFRDVCRILPFDADVNDIESGFAKTFPAILVAYAKAQLQIKDPQGILLTRLLACVHLPTAQVVYENEYNIASYGLGFFCLCRDPQLVKVTDGSVEKFDWAFSHFHCWAGLSVITLASHDGRYCVFYWQGGKANIREVRGRRV